MENTDTVSCIALTIVCCEDTRTAWRIVRRIREMETDLGDFFSMSSDRRRTQFQDEVFDLVFDRDMSDVLDRAREMADSLDEQDVAVVTSFDDAYPRRLISVAGDAVPPVMYVVGEMSVFDGPALGIVGSRRASESGLEYAWSLARTASERGVLVVSGGATGIDSAAHRGALDADGNTVVVLPHGLGHGSVGRLMDEHSDSVTIVSQFAPDLKPCPRAALARNRTIAGLSDAVVAVESGVVSGTMSTARHARRLSVPLFAVGWEDDDPVHLGTAKLLKGGAEPLPSDLSVEDGLDALFAVIEGKK